MIRNLTKSRHERSTTNAHTGSKTNQHTCVAHERGKTHVQLYKMSQKTIVTFTLPIPETHMCLINLKIMFCRAKNSTCSSSRRSALMKCQHRRVSRRTPINFNLVKTSTARAITKHVVSLKLPPHAPTEIVQVVASHEPQIRLVHSRTTTMNIEAHVSHTSPPYSQHGDLNLQPVHPRSFLT